MAKTKVSELAEELGRDKKEILDFLHKKNIDAKIGSSSVEDDAAAMVRSEFGKAAAKAGSSVKAEGTAKAAAKTPAPKAEKEKTAAKAKDIKAEAKPETQGSVRTEAPEKPEEKKTAAPAGEEAKPEEQHKKKKIIMVSNPNNSHFGGNGQHRPSGSGYQDDRQDSRRGSYSAGNNNRGYSQPHQFIRPLQKPKPVTDEPYDVRQRREQERHEQEQRRVHDDSVRTVQNENTVNTVQPDQRAHQETNTAAVRPESRPQAETAARQNTPSQEVRTHSDQQAGTQSRDTRSMSDSQTRSYSQSQQPASSQGERNSAYGSHTDQQRRTSSQEHRPYNSRPQYGQSSSGRPYQGRPSYGSRPNSEGGRPVSGQGDRHYQGSHGPGRPDNRGGYGSSQQGGRFGSSDNRGSSYGAGGGRTYGGGNRNFNHNAGPGNRFGKSAASGEDSQFSTAKDTEKRRDEEKRRNAQERDHKSRKDLIYEDEEKLKNRPGRFIKPEKREEAVEEEKIKVINIPQKINIRDLADKMKLQPSVIIKKLFLDGQIVTLNTELDFEDAENIAAEYDILCEKLEEQDIIKELLKEEEEDASKLKKRPPVVCVMGHVDHGKTSLLDAIRKTSVTSHEAGGITQAIGAYTVKAKGQNITFLDTPGHEAFTAMRMRGAKSTDIAVLVVAADDGVMPQTVEAISHAKAAGIEIIVAVNKIDKPNANIERVKQELTEYELVATDWGGSTEFVPVSAKTGEGIDTLLETILLTAELLELKANPDRNARGVVIEAKLDKGRGPVATVLVQKGTLHVGSFISAGASYGKVRAMIDDKGNNVKDAEPSTPVEILGLGDVPEAGETFIAHENEKTAKNFAATYRNQHKADMIAESKSRMSMDDVFARVKEGSLKELDLIVKADVQGSVEALKQSLGKLSNEEVAVKCIHGGVGAINESDVILASASNAIIIGFNVRPDATAKATADRENVEIKLYSVIYQAIDDVEAALKGMLAPVYEEKIIGHAEVRQIFKASAIGNIAGAFITDGSFQKDCLIRIRRDGEQIYEGKLASLKRFKDDAKEVKEGYECGLVFDGFDQMKELDQVEAYIMAEVPRK